MSSNDFSKTRRHHSPKALAIRWVELALPTSQKTGLHFTSVEMNTSEHGSIVSYFQTSQEKQ
jgi:hypothetical protein